MLRGIDLHNPPEEAKYGDTFEMVGDFSPKTYYWWGGDNWEEWKKNKDLEHMLVWHDTLPGDSNPLTYDINSHGFRTKELDSFDSNSIMLLGCSMTFGIGVHEETTFAHHLSKYLDDPIINLGYPGGSLDSMYRIYSYWQPRIKSKNTIILIPPGCRFESAANDKGRFWYKWGIHRILAMKAEGKLTKESAIMTSHFFEERQVAVNMQRNLNAIKNIARETNSSLYIFDNEDREIASNLKLRIDVGIDVGRDNSHPGPVWHEKTAKIMVERFFK